jgi:hydrogenase maturation factor
LASTVTDAQKALLTDPQTSGGLLVSCAADAVQQVLKVFADSGFGDAAVIGRMKAGAPGLCGLSASGSREGAQPCSPFPNRMQNARLKPGVLHMNVKL